MVSAIVLEIFYSSLAFILGFALGTVIDIIFFKIHNKIDREGRSTTKIITLLMLQVAVLAVSIKIANDIIKDDIARSIFQNSLISSQVYMVGYAIVKVSHDIYDRKAPPLSSVSGIVRAIYNNNPNV